MPSPGQSAIANFIGQKSFVVEGGFNTSFSASGQFVQGLSSAMDTGWTSATPTTPTTMSTAFNAEFSAMLAGNGYAMVMCIAQGIDDEVSAWVSSWDNTISLHTYTPNVAAIVGRIQACAPIWSQGAQAIATVSAEAFIQWFEQEVG